MKSIREFIESGILESYVMGLTTPDETEKVQLMAASSFEIREEIELISIALEQYGQANAITPHPAIRPFLMASIDYSERMKNGEKPTIPPLLNAGSKISDFSSWLNRPDLVPSKTFNDIEAKIIGIKSKVLTAIVWVKDLVPQEVHRDEIESFLIVEGTCDLFIEGKVYSFVPGDFFTIAPHQNHYARVTSTIPCKVIVQRVSV